MSKRKRKPTPPWSMPLAAREVIKSWPIRSKSPFSLSFYDVESGQKTWDHTPLDSHRISDHWNFRARGATHCPTDVPVENKVWALGKWDGTQYVILQVFGTRRHLIDIREDELHTLDQPSQERWRQMQHQLSQRSVAAE